MGAVYGNSALSFAIVKFWEAEFNRSHISLVNNERSRRPKTATTTDNIRKNYGLVINDRQVKLREISETTFILKECVYHILTEDLGFGQTRNGMNISKALLRQLK
ncbi:hypothetical protein Trydic_g981 [Trypoxylus dichotomus]